MDKDSEDSSDNLPSIDVRSRMAFFEHLNKTQESSQPQVKQTRRGHPPQKQAYPVSTTTTTGYREQIEKSELTTTKDDVASQGYRHSSPEQSEMIYERKSTTSESSEWSPPNNMEIFQRPMCLISAKSEENEMGEETKIVLKNEKRTIEQIQQIEWPLVVVAVAGLYRTGKSYLMNRLADSSTGFALGDAIESKTKGIWVWCKIHPKRSKTVLMLLDTEGLGDVEKGDPNHDNKIFTLATLLCNCLVYNMKGAFDNDAITKLTFVTEMAKNIRFRGEASEDNQAVNLILPDFVLCIRDFSLKLKKGERELSENEYLEESLAEKKSKTKDFNKPRECIRKYFRKRECFVFPVPGDGDVLENLERLSFSDLSSKFKEATKRFVSYIYDKPPKAILASKAVNGQMFVVLVDRFVTAMIHGAVPDVDDAFTAVAKVENAKIETRAIEIFDNQMKNLTIPVPRKVLWQVYTEAQKTALKYLQNNVVHDNSAQCLKQAKVKMDTIWTKIEKDNDEKVREMCEKKLQEAYKRNFEVKIENRDYEIAGGHRRFQSDFKMLKKEYTSVLRDFDKSEILWAWHGFVKRMKDSEKKIVEADENISLEEKKEEQRRNQENIEKVLKEQQKAQQEALEKQKQDLESHYKKLEEDRIEQEKIEREKYEALVKEKMDKESAQREVDRYKREEEERKNKWVGARVWNAFWNS